MNYVTSDAGISPQSETRRRCLIGVIFRNEHLHSSNRLLDGVQNYSLESGNFETILLPVRDGWAPGDELLSRLRGAVVSLGLEDESLVELLSAKLPIVNCTPDFVGRIPSVSTGCPHATAFRHLLGLGRKSLAYIDLETGGPGLREVGRLEEIAAREGVKLQVFRGVKLDPAKHPEQILTCAGESGLEEFLMRLPKPAGLWCVHDELAAMVWNAAERLKFAIPSELALMGIGDHGCALHTTPGLSTINLASEKAGYAAAKCLHEHLGRNEVPAPGLVVPVSEKASVVERLSTGGNFQNERNVQRAWRMLEDYPQEGLTVEHLIEVSKLSRVGFYKQFEKAFGMPPGKAIRLARVRKAKAILTSSDMQISKVGRLCGFSGESDFNNFFKREVGLPPQAWRQKMSDPKNRSAGELAEPVVVATE